MANSIVITIKSEDTVTDLEQLLQIDATVAKDGALAVEKYIRDLRSNIRRGIIDVQVGASAPVAASGTYTLVSCIATDAVAIAGVTLTASSTPADENEWEIDGASDALDAASLAACINAHSVLSKIVVATVASNIVTVTARVKGIIGNYITFTDADTTITSSGSGYLAGGTGGAQDDAVSYALGIS